MELGPPGPCMGTMATPVLPLLGLGSSCSSTLPVSVPRVSTWPGCVCVLACVLSHVSLPPDGLKPARLPLSMEIVQARILEWVVIPFSSGSSQPRDQTCVSGIGRRILYH